jgi:hypothetical protein
VVQDDLHTSLIAVSPVDHDLPVVIDGVEVVDVVPRKVVGVNGSVVEDLMKLLGTTSQC